MRAYGTTNAAPWATAPSVGPAGEMYFNTTTKIVYVSDGTAWLATGPVTFVNTTAANLGGNSTAFFACAPFPLVNLRAGALYRIRGNGAFQRSAGTLVLGVYLQLGGNQLAIASEATIGAGSFTLDVHAVADGAGLVTTTGHIITATRTTSPSNGPGGTIYTTYNTYGGYTPMPTNSFTIGGAFSVANAANFMGLAGGSMEIL